MKQIRVQNDNLGRIELLKLNRKGFYNFIRYIQQEDIQNLHREFKGYELINKTNY